jgi:zinc ribbon protein
MWEHRGPMSAIAHSCGSCGTEVPAGARFCASCGARAVSVGGPVSWSTSGRRYFGVVPGQRVAGAVRRKGGRLLAVVRSRLRLALVVIAARVAAEVERYRLRRRAAQLEADRARQLHALGDAVYRGDRKPAVHIRVRIRELDRRMEAVKEKLGRVERSAQEQIARARMEGGPTNIVEPTPGAPEPPIVPEPEPVPHEPPGPVIVPEPEPEPHEPPGPVIVPEPQPPTE